MGHAINYIIVDRNADRATVIADICEEVEHSAWQEGGSYNGTLKKGSHWHEGTVYDSEEDAREAISRFDNGWYDDYAVLFRDTSALESAATKRIAGQIAKTKEKKRDYIEANHVTGRKSAFIGCSCCGSKLSREHLKRDACPLCGADLRSETVCSRIEGFNEKLQELESRLTDEKKKLAKKAPIKWLVKYEYHI